MKNKNVSILGSIIFIILGIVIFSRPDAVVKFISYILGGILIVVGIYKCLNYYIKDKNLKVVNYYELAFGITAIVLGLLFILLAGTIELLLRIVVGIWLILQGLNSICQTFYMTNRDKSFVVALVIGIIYIGAGLYIVLKSNLVLQTIGLFMAIYGIMDLVRYFIIKNDNKEDVKVERVEEIEFTPKEESTKKKGKKK